MKLTNRGWVANAKTSMIETAHISTIEIDVAFRRQEIAADQLDPREGYEAKDSAAN